ncbi:SDR family NAD(P)-dependent oxidoreductase [Phytoactinopolyspora limicola]|uniref:SDR family NAD(P)-dependent oxidoreductase n=1 Tax=Phytoactinopolyspora limicola TaxID=2715536 RepID=UPI00140C4036|nr:SDR family oxidoreductase [Phytoactinopolyspora limicola]
MQRFRDRVVFVTGGARGIGRAIARRLIEEGAHVVIADVDGAVAEETAGALGDTAAAVSCDVRDVESVNAAIATTMDRFGRLDTLVNNVGINGGPPFEELTDADWDEQVDPTLYGAVRCIKAALPALVAAPHGGAVVSVGSVNGLAAFGSIPYSAAKAGLVNLTQNLAIRYGPQGVRFNLVAPGTVRTRAWEGWLRDSPGLQARLDQLYPLGRIGEPADIAAAVAYLASDDASWVTGTVLRVDGGLLAGVPGFLAALDEPE